MFCFVLLHLNTVLPAVMAIKDNKNHHEYESGIEKSVPRITDWHHEASRVMTNGGQEGRIFLSHPHTKYGFIFFLTTKYLILYWKKHTKGFHKLLNTLVCDIYDMLTSFEHNNDVMDPRSASVWLFSF